MCLRLARTGPAGYGPRAAGRETANRDRRDPADRPALADRPPALVDPVSLTNHGGGILIRVGRFAPFAAARGPASAAGPPPSRRGPGRGPAGVHSGSGPGAVTPAEIPTARARMELAGGGRFGDFESGTGAAAPARARIAGAGQASLTRSAKSVLTVVYRVPVTALRP